MRLFPYSRAAVISTAYLALHFLWFAFDGTRVGWTEDDPMNLFQYWKVGFAKVAVSNFTFWTGFYRPLGGLFYLPIYAAAGMNPAPYRWAAFVLLALNAFLVWRLALQLTDSVRAAGFACLFACVHGWMFELLYATSQIYDVLCVTFALLALALYTSRRRVDAPIGIGRGVLVLVSMVFAINAKEIAATLPAFLLLYEILFHPPSKNGWADWLRRRALWSFIALVVAAGAMYGKMHGPDAMTINDQYRPVFTLARWIDSNVAYTAEIFYRREISPSTAAAIWLGMAAIAWVSKSRAMAWAAGFVLLATIPIAFIPKRMGGSMYLPLTGWAIWFAALIDWLISLLPRRLDLGAASTLVVALAFSVWTARGFEGAGDWWRRTQATPNRVLATLESFDYRPPHGARVLFVGSPYKDVFDMVFLSNLVWNDHSLEIEDANMAADHGSDWSPFDIVIGFKTAGEGLEILKH